MGPGLRKPSGPAVDQCRVNRPDTRPLLTTVQIVSEKSCNAGAIHTGPPDKDQFMADQWGLGPAFVALKQENGWTYGSLLNHVRDFDAPSERYDVNATFLQPFVSIHDA
jgi:hypothetical protein